MRTFFLTATFLMCCTFVSAQRMDTLRNGDVVLLYTDHHPGGAETHMYHLDKRELANRYGIAVHQIWVVDSVTNSSVIILIEPELRDAWDIYQTWDFYCPCKAMKNSEFYASRKE